MKRRSRILACAVAAATAAASAVLGVSPAGAAQPGAHQPGPGGASHRVTLITGDVVQATPGPNGDWSLGVQPAQRDIPVGFSQFAKRRGKTTDWYLIPGDAARLVSTGALDLELFNITGQIRQGYDDAKSDSVPLLVEYADNATSRRGAALAGAKVTRTMAELPVAAASTRKADTAQFWQSIAPGASAAQLVGGPTKLWLNAKVTASLDVSVPQIGAPAAWQAGHTGKGVTVAVLDTGIDAEHADLAGKVTQSKDFSGSNSVKDGNGHGTHVASTIAGSGAASGGKYKGVAPDAGLAVGKVLDDSGSGSFADVLAGMEWAASEVKAKVISMSLGGGTSDGTDPMSQAVNTLTQKYGALFVIAAGNYGSDESVTSPATADSALAVGSVTKGDSLSDFSSRGPRNGDGAVKPEISAPGSDIVAARAKGTQLGEPVNESYTKLSGTSMATPHTAGAAAILAQQHPGWTADQLKASMVNSAKPLPDHNVFAVGSGRLDVAAAVTQSVQAVPAAVNSYLKWPDTKAQQRAVTYHNSGTAPLTLALTLNLADSTGQAAPEKLAKLSASTVTVPAGGKTTVDLTLTPRSGRSVGFGGVLTAASADGKTQVRTPVGVYDEPTKYDLTVQMRDRNGAEQGPDSRASASVINLDTGDWYFGGPGEKLRLSPGRYSVTGSINTLKAGSDPSLSMVAHPELKVNKNTTVSFDARKAKRVSISTDQPAARGGYWTARFTSKVAGYDYPFGSLYLMEPRFTEVYAYSTPGVSSPGFGYANNVRFIEPDLELFARKPQEFELGAYWFRDSPEPHGTQALAAVHGGQGRPEDLAGLDVKGKLVLLELPGSTTYDEAHQRIANVKNAGGALVAINVLESAALSTKGKARADSPVVLPTVRLFGASAARFSALVKAGGVTTDLTSRQSSKYRYELSFPAQGRVPDKLSYAVKTADLAAVTMAYHGNTPEEPPIVGAYVEANGTEIGTNWHTAGVAQSERVEYYTPGNWRIEVGGWWGASGTLAEKIKLDAAKNYRLSWNAAVAGPGFAGTTSNELGKNHPWAWVKGGLLDITVPLYADAVNHPRLADTWLNTSTGSTKLYRGDELAGSSNQPGRGVFVVPRGPEEYRLTTEANRDKPWWPLSTKVSGSWTFKPGYVQNPSGALPLLAVRYAPAVDLRNTAPGGRQFSFPVTVPRQDGPAKITKLELEVSYDDGATWAPAPVTQNGAAWTATVSHPASGFASLRAKAADTDGNTVEQTVIRAYQIGG